MNNIPASPRTESPRSPLGPCKPIGPVKPGGPEGPLI